LLLSSLLILPSIDDFTLAPVTAFTPPTPTQRTSIAAATATSVFPFVAACTPTAISDWQSQCVHESTPQNYLNWVKNPDFEDDCTTNAWDFNFISGVDQLLTTITTEEAHSGSKSLKVVFNAGGGTLNIKFKNTADICEYRNYRWSFWTKQRTAGACKVQVRLGGKRDQDVDAGPADTWTQTDLTFYSPFLTSILQPTDLELQIFCTQGGPEAAIYLDDILFQNVYSF
jgi:hypothetical protein